MCRSSFKERSKGRYLLYIILIDPTLPLLMFYENWFLFSEVHHSFYFLYRTLCFLTFHWCFIRIAFWSPISLYLSLSYFFSLMCYEKFYVYSFLSTTSSTTSVEDTDFTKFDEHKLREHLRQLKADRAVVKLTIMELESVHLDPFSFDLEPNPDAQRLDLENAVLMQELMAMKVYFIRLWKRTKRWMDR